MYRLNYFTSDLFETEEEARKAMMRDYHFNAVEGNVYDENEPDYIISADFDDASATVTYKDGLVLKWKIEKID